MASLVSAVKDSERRKEIIKDCDALIREEVADKRGLTGIAVKGGFKMIKSFRPDIVPQAMDDLIDDFAEKVDPFWLECQEKGHDPQQFFTQRQADVANSLLSITDERAQKSKHRVLVKAYNKLRGRAVDHIGSAMPRFAKLLVKHAS